MNGLGRTVGYRSRTLCGRQHNTSGKRRNKIVAFADAIQSDLDPHDRSHVGCIAVGVPPGGVDNLLRFIEVVRRVSPRHGHDGMVRYDMTVATVLVIPVLFIDAVVRFSPVAVGDGPLVDIAMNRRNEAVGGNLLQCGGDNIVHVLRDKRLANHGCDHHGCVDRLAIMRNRRRLPRQISRQLRVPRSDHAEGVDEYLRADLFSHNLPIARDGPRFRRFQPVLQTQVGRMFGRVTHAAPPQNRLPFDQVIQPHVTEEFHRCLLV